MMFTVFMSVMASLVVTGIIEGNKNPCAWSKTHPIYHEESQGCVNKKFFEKKEEKSCH